MKTCLLLLVAMTFTASSAFATQTCEESCDASATNADEALACYDSCFVPGAAVVSHKKGGKIVPGPIDGKLTKTTTTTTTKLGGKIIPGRNDGK